MIRPEQRVFKAVATASRHCPELVEWLRTVYTHEMNRLPYATTNPTVFQGRCQMINELLEFLEQAPDIAAKS